MSNWDPYGDQFYQYHAVIQRRNQELKKAVDEQHRIAEECSPPAPEPKAVLVDQFAMAALTGMMANPSITEPWTHQKIAEDAYIVARCMMAERGDA